MDLVARLLADNVLISGMHEHDMTLTGTLAVWTRCHLSGAERFMYCACRLFYIFPGSLILRGLRRQIIVVCMFFWLSMSTYIPLVAGLTWTSETLHR
jgi:hypothetical protein